jgi:hypothetical protein
VLCGHLDPDLVRVADDLLGGGTGEFEPQTDAEPVAFPVAAPYSASEEVGSVMPARHDNVSPGAIK